MRIVSSAHTAAAISSLRRSLIKEERRSQARRIAPLTGFRADRQGGACGQKVADEFTVEPPKKDAMPKIGAN
jgi:hypothetical protein